jgi:Transposase and inactivated derivatives
MAITKEVLDELLKEYKGPEDLTGPEGLLKQLTKALIERAMDAEITTHLGYEKHDQSEKDTTNRRNGRTKKTVRSDQGPLEIEIPRDREGTFEPAIVPKHQREFKGFDDKIISMYSRGMTTREITEHLKEIYGTEISPELVSRVTDEVKELLEAWRARSLETSYPIVFLDALMINVREDGKVVKKSIYMALAINWEGRKELLGLWIDQAEGAKFWMRVLSELKNRGLQDILIAVVDGLSGFPEAIATIFPKTEIQLCIVHMVRNSLKFVPYKDRKAVAADLKAIYASPSEEAALAALDIFAAKWDSRFPMISRSWRMCWPEVVTYFKFPEMIRKAIYTTNAIESLNYTVRKVTRNRLSFPSAEAAMKLVFMALQNISKKWTMPIHEWKSALGQFIIFYGDRVPL